MKTLLKKDNCSIVFGEWYDKYNGNTYYDANITINGAQFQIPYAYGYNHGDRQAVEESLRKIGYRLRKCSKDCWQPYREIHIVCVNKLKRELFK